MQKNWSTFIFAFLGMCMAQPIAAQVEIYPASVPPYTTQSLIENVFLGEGVVVKNITFTGDARSVGYFNRAGDDIGIERGIVMTTGHAEDVGGLNCPLNPFETQPPSSNCSNNGDSGTNSNGGSDPDLLLLSNATVTDAAIYEIEFIPLADTLSFQYVFASEEYPEYVCSQFNDVFGFFISGPGYNGPFTNNAENIALIPNSTLPVAINTVNQGTAGSQGSAANCTSLAFSQYYNDNTSSQAKIIYDGFTDIFTATAVVVPCQTYKIKIVIGDISDEDLDSGVFLAANSFGTGSIRVNTVTTSIDGAVAEGCSSAEITFSIPFPATRNIPLNYTIFGDAQNSIDYDFVPNNLFIPQGQKSVKITINPLADGLNEPIEAFKLSIQKDPCTIDTIEVLIKDNGLERPNLPPNQLICPSETLQLDATVPNATPPPPRFQKIENASVLSPPLGNELAVIPFTSSIDVSGVIPNILQDNVLDSVCFTVEHTWPSDLDIFLIAPSGQLIELTSDNGSSGLTTAPDGYLKTCFTPSATFPIDSILPCPMAPCPNLAPFTGTWKPENAFNALYGSPTNGTWQLLLIDDTPFRNGILRDWSISFKPAYTVTYEWSPSNALSCDDCAMPIASPATTTQYIATATDSYGCSSKDTILIEIKSVLPPPIPICGNATQTTATFDWTSVTGATNYEVSTDQTNWSAPSNPPLSHTLTGLTPGQNATLFIRAVGCQNGRDTSIVCQTIGCLDVVSVSSNNPVCNGASINLVATGGVSYEWSGPNNFTSTSDAPSIPNADSIHAGNYVVTITTPSACKIVQTLRIDKPSKIRANVSVSNVRCNGANDGRAIVQVAASSGIAPYTFLWSDANNSTNDSIFNLAPNTYTVTITDAANCQITATALVQQPPTLTVNINNTQANCPTSRDATATAMGVGGTGNLTYRWSNNQTSNQISQLGVGTYAVTVTDANGCTATASTNITTLSNLVSNVVSTKSQICNQANDGNATASATGGVGALRFLWSNGSATASVNNLSAGKHYVSISDANNCTVVDSITITSFPAIVASVTNTAASCNNGSNGTATINSIAGGAGTVLSDYTYRWNTTPVQTSLTATNLQGGQTYQVIISDARACSLVVSTSIANPSAIAIQLANSKNVSCFAGNDGNLSVNAQGGTGNISFAWSNGQTGAAATNLSAGNYTVTATDANNCTSTQGFAVTMPDSISINFNIQNINCQGNNTGSVVTNVSGGTPTYRFAWSNGATSANISNLAAGTYRLTVTDANNCVKIASASITQPTPLGFTLSIREVICQEDENGQITINATGGNPPYQYSINSSPFFNSPIFSNLGAANYQIRVRDASNCLVVKDTILQNPPAISVSLNVDAVNFLELGDTILVESHVTNSSGAVVYNWQESSSGTLSCTDCANPVIKPDKDARYTLTITDEEGCSTSIYFDVKINKQIKIFVPTAFTPNGDGTNDLLQVHGKSKIQVLSFKVFDRWGELVYNDGGFEVNSTTSGWDGTLLGKPVNSGTFVWHLEVEYEGRKAFFKGNTSLIR